MVTDYDWFQDDEGRRVKLIRARAQIVRAIRDYFDGQSFLEVDTPLRVPSPGLDLHLTAFEAKSQWLITSPEYQMKRLLSAGFDRIYQICKCFRDDELGHLHEPEFTMLEWYRTHAGSLEVMQDTEALVAHVARALYGEEKIPGVKGTVIDVSAPWPRMTVREAFQKYANTSMDDVLPDEEKFFRILIDIEPKLGSARPMFLTHYPSSMASLARLDPQDPTTADRFEAYLDGIELCNGFGELTDATEQRTRLEKDQHERHRQGLPVYPIDETFLMALDRGMPESGGNALGVDRLVMLALGETSIEDVVAFPSARL